MGVEEEFRVWVGAGGWSKGLALAEGRQRWGRSDINWCQRQGVCWNQYAPGRKVCACECVCEPAPSAER